MDDRLSATFVPMAAVDEIIGDYRDIRKSRHLENCVRDLRLSLMNDVIFAKITPCMQNGKSAVARGLANGLGFGSTEFHVIRCGPRVLPEWLWYYLRQHSVKEEAQRNFRRFRGSAASTGRFFEATQDTSTRVRMSSSRLLFRISECMERIDEIRTAPRRRNSRIKVDRVGYRSMNSSMMFEGVLRWPLVRLGDLTIRRASMELRSRPRSGTRSVRTVLRMGNIVDGYLDYLGSQVRPFVRRARRGSTCCSRETY